MSQDPSANQPPPGQPIYGPPPGPPGQPAYGQPPPATPGTNVMAILALIFAFVFAPLGIVFGVIGRRQIDRTGEGGRGLATAGLVLGIIFTVISILSVIALVVLLGAAVNDLNRPESGYPDFGY